MVVAAVQTGADAIHPGYGIGECCFARKVEAAGIRFIGPTPEVIAAMGDKVTARRQMAAAGVPTVPGTQNGVLQVEEALAAAKGIGYPVMLKASAGGGGIRMVVCRIR